MELAAFVDSGADAEFIDLKLAQQLLVPMEPLPEALLIRALDGSLLGRATHRTRPLLMSVGEQHREWLSFLVISSPQAPIMLGFPWLRKHNPRVDWMTGRILDWGVHCFGHCLALPPPKPLPAVTPEHSDMASVPEVYHGLARVFSKALATSLPPHRHFDCAIDLHPGASPPRGRLYQLSAPERTSMNQYIQESLAAGIIRPSSSPAGAGFFFVEKKDKSLRPCIDYRGLNAITIRNRYPLPLMASAFELLHGATIFTKLDLRNAYHLVRIREGDEWKTAFNTPAGHYEYLVMPFGLTNAPAVFQALVNEVLRDMLNTFVFVYLDDILIFSRSMDEHIRQVRQVLERLLKNGLYVKPEKCEFHTSQTSFLGYLLSAGNIRMDPARVQAIRDWPTPTSRRHLQRFLGFANFYRRFVKGYSSVAAPLHLLTSSLRSFFWGPEAEEAFLELKRRFTEAPILIFPDPARQFVVEVDASGVGVGAVLSQVCPEDNRLHPCAFFSRRLSSSERNYPVGERELLAVKLALEEWRHWLEGAEVPFLVWTDHRNLEYLQSAKRLNPRQARWGLFFGRFRFSLSYRPGSRNVKPDALSRVHALEEEEPCPETILAKSVSVHTLSLALEERVKNAQDRGPVPEGCPTGLLFVPEGLRPGVLQWCHNSLFFCHPGQPRTLSLVKARFWWPSVVKDTRDFVAACPDCAQHKNPRGRPHGLLRPLPIPKRPWSHIAMDFVTGLPISSGNTVVMTVIDRFSKMGHFIALPKLPSAKETAKLALQHIFRLHGFPRDIVSDRGPQFSAQFWRFFC
ncbi:hypothetical protein C0J45_23069, partial [Silurus meridionalis]